MTIFPSATISRKRMRWDDYLYAQTPVVERNGRRYKRDDYFAPLGAGGINGAKLRQLVYLVGRARAEGKSGLLTGASVLSPQNPMAALTAAHFGIPSRVVLGGTRLETALRHENIQIAAAAGADFSFVPVGYNPALQRAVRDLADTPAYANWYRLPYGISCQENAGDSDIRAFHRVGAEQAASVPPDTHTILIPFGSGNSAASILYGLALYPPPALRRVVLFGIGPTRLEWLHERLAAVERSASAAGEPLDILGRFSRRYHSHPSLAIDHDAAYGGGAWELEHHDLHATKFASYSDRKPFTLDGIPFHPTYEGKVLSYLAANRSAFENWWTPSPASPSLFWIVGSEPSLRAMAPVLGLGR